MFIIQLRNWIIPFKLSRLEWGTRPTLAWKFRAKLSEMSFLPFLRKSAVVILRQQFKMFDSNNFTLSSMFSFQNTWQIKRKAVYTYLSSFP